MKGRTRKTCWSGVEYCGTFLNGVREVGVKGGVLRYEGVIWDGVWSWVYMNGGHS